MHYVLVEMVKKHTYLLHDAKDVYVFGSVLNLSKKPRDIDILIIYFNYTSTIEEETRKFSEELENDRGLSVDLTILSVEEEREVCFLDKIKALKVK